MKYNQEDHRNRSKPVGSKRSIEKIEEISDGCEGRKL